MNALFLCTGSDLVLAEGFVSFIFLTFTQSFKLGFMPLLVDVQIYMDITGILVFYSAMRVKIYMM